MKRTVYTWSIKYSVMDRASKSMAGGLNTRRLSRSSDGGPYLNRDNAEAAAKRATIDLTDLHGAGNVDRYTIRAHLAPVAQPAFE